MKSERAHLPLTIARLVRSATPVQPLAAPSLRAARWAIASTAFAGVSVLILGVRSDIAPQLASFWFLGRAVVTLALALTAATVATCMGVPGAEPSAARRALPVAMWVVWGVMLLGPIGVAQSPLDLLLQAQPHFSCVRHITAIALPPGVALVWLLRQAAPLHPLWAGGLAGLASLAVGGLGAQVVCANDAAAHHLLWHFMPVGLLALATLAAGTSLFGWPFRRGL